MSYKYAVEGQSAFANNLFPWCIVLTVIAKRPVQQIFEFKEKELAEKFFVNSNSNKYLVAIRLYDPEANV